MKKDLCELIVVLDKSGSMDIVTNDTIGGFNTFLETHQNMPGEAKLTLVQFDTRYNIMHNGVNVKDVPKLDRSTYIPAGGTALLDAVGKTIDDVSRRLLADTSADEYPEKVIFLIITDGEENQSKEYTRDQVKNKITHLKETEEWEFVFMGADQDAWGNASNIGVGNAVNYTVKDINTKMKGMAFYSSKFRSNDNTRGLADFDLSSQQLDDELDKYNKPDKDKV